MWLPLAVFLVGSVIVFWRWGLPLRNDWTWMWVLAGLLVVSLHDLRGWLRGLLVDWLPFIAALAAYDATRGAVDGLLSARHALPQIDFDTLLFFGHLPTVWLQHALYDPGRLHWWDYGAWGIYTTHFVVTVAVAAVLWHSHRERFRRFRAMVVTLAFAGAATYALYPAVPPWMAAREHLLPHVARITLHVSHHLSPHTVGPLFERGVNASNPVAAVPSLHAAFPVLLLLFFWSSGRWVRLALGAYALTMALTLVYAGEHYVADALLGWAYAGGAFYLIGNWASLRGFSLGRLRRFRAAQ